MVREKGPLTRFRSSVKKLREHYYRYNPHSDFFNIDSMKLRQIRIHDVWVILETQAFIVIISQPSQAYKGVQYDVLLIPPVTKRFPEYLITSFSELSVARKAVIEYMRGNLI